MFPYYLGITLTVLFTVYGQLVLKWQIPGAEGMPDGLVDKLYVLLGLLLNPWVISAFAAAVLAALSWMAVLTKFEISYAYPFMSISFVIVLILGWALFGESMTTPKIAGTALIVAGILVGSQG